ncbi:MAG: AIDA repeat-containing protein [Methylococcaceae bacterium]
MATYNVASGVTSTSVTLNGGDTLNILNGGITNNLAVNGSIISGTVVSAVATVLAGGTANKTTITFGGIENVYGTVNNTTISPSGGIQHVYLGGIASSTINGGAEYILSGGVANNATVNGGKEYISNGGIANNTIVNNGGYEYISSGGVANNTIVNSGGNENVNRGGVASNTIVNNGGRENIYGGGVANNTVVNSGGNEYISNGGVANNTIVNSGGRENIYGGGVANNTVVNSGGNEYISNGGVASNTIVNSGGNENIYSGGVANNTIVNSGGFEYVSGGVASNTIVNIFGNEYIYSGGVVNNTIVNDYGFEHIYSGGIANSTILNSGGNENIYSGGVANNTIVNSGGYEFINNGGIASNTIVNSGGYEFINNSGIASNTIVSNGGYEVISNGGIANNTIVNSGGYEYIRYGGVASSTIVNSGGIEVISGGTAAGLILNMGATVDLISASFDNASVNASNQLVLTSGGITVSTLNLGGDNTGKAFVVHSDGNGGTDVTVYAAPIISGTVAGQAVNDNQSLSPFSTVTLTDANTGVSETLTIKLDDASKGAFTADSLTASGFTSTDNGLTYTHAADTVANLQAAVQTLVYQPATNHVAPNSTETTHFSLSFSDSLSTTTNTTASVVVTSVNDAPTLNGGSAVTFSFDNTVNDTTISSVVSVATLLDSSHANYADVDTSSPQGIAITATSGGTWYYNTSNSTTGGTAITGQSTTTPLLLDSADYLYFVPTAGTIGTAKLNFLGWDETTGTALSLGNATTTGGTTAYSSNSAEADLTVIPSNHAPVITSDGGGATASINAVQFLTAVTTVTATDADNDTLSYSITGGADKSLFQINSTSGALSFKTAPQISNNYEVQVTASDNKGGTAVQTDTITVLIDTDRDGIPDIFDTDIDNDGLANSIESLVANANGSGTGDGNGDGIADTAQINVASLPTVAGASRYATLAVANGLSLTNVSNSAAPSGLPRSVKMPLGEFSFTINNVTTGDTVNLSIYVDKTLNINSYYKQDANGVWQNIATSSSSVGNKTQINFSLTDGGQYDADHTVNGVIVDPSAPAQTTPLITSNGGDITASVSIDENTTAVTTVQASNVISYAITGGADQTAFSINSSTGALSFINPPDFENPSDSNSNNSYLVEVTASDNNHGSDTQSLTVDVNNLTGVSIHPTTAQTTAENGSNATYSIVLNDAPTTTVVLNFSSSDTSEGTVTPALSFSPSNWNTPQNLIVHGVDDYLNDGNIAYNVTVSVNTTDVQYKNLSINPLQLSNLDDGRDAPSNLDGDLGNTKPRYDTLVGLDGNDQLHGYTMSDSLSGGIGNDSLWGGYGNDSLDGGVGNDLLNGEAGADLISGNAGNDSLDGGMGIDTLDGGAGNDIYYLGYYDRDTINDTGNNPADIDTVIIPFQVTTYSLPNTIENGIISAGINTYTGISVYGTVNANSDTLIGNSRNNVLIGNEGNNTLNGGLGNDTLTGGTGQDTFYFSDSINSSNVDKITDYLPIDDTIQLNHSIFSVLTTTGVLNNAYLKIGSVAGDNNDYIIYNPSTGLLSYDADANNSKISALPIALLGTGLTITNADFLIN